MLKKFKDGNLPDDSKKTKQNSNSNGLITSNSSSCEHLADDTLSSSSHNNNNGFTEKNHSHSPTDTTASENSPESVNLKALPNGDTSRCHRQGGEINSAASEDVADTESQSQLELLEYQQLQRQQYEEYYRQQALLQQQQHQQQQMYYAAQQQQAVAAEEDHLQNHASLEQERAHSSSDIDTSSDSAATVIEKTSSTSNAVAGSSVNEDSSAIDAVFPTLDDVTESTSSQSINSAQGNRENYDAIQHDHRIISTPPDLAKLSKQINGLISDSEINGTTSGQDELITDLELHNTELKQKLRAQVEANDVLTSQVDAMKTQGAQLQQRLVEEKEILEHRLGDDVAELRNQLQIHIQTIGILVAEKTELTSRLSQKHKSTENNIEEIDDLSGRLKASRENVNDLEQALNKLTSEHEKSTISLTNMAKELDSTKSKVYALSTSSEELTNQNSELRLRLRQKTADYTSISDSNKTLSKQLEMSQLHIQQLKSGQEVISIDQQKLESLQAEKIELQATISNYDEMFAAQITEKEQIAQQYDICVSDLKNSNASLKAEVDKISGDFQNLCTVKETLDKKLEDLSTPKENIVERNADDIIAIEKLLNEIAELKNSHADHQLEIKTANTLNKELIGGVNERDLIIKELRGEVVRVSDQAVSDGEQLLTGIQNDKAALSRAVAQNKQLKQQLEELQDGFVKISNQNMENATLHQKEQHLAKELSERLQQQEIELSESRNLAESRQASIVMLKNRLDEVLNDGDEDDNDLDGEFSRSSHDRSPPASSHSPPRLSHTTAASSNILQPPEFLSAAHLQHLCEDLRNQLASSEKTITELKDSHNIIERQLLQSESNNKVNSEQNKQISLDQSGIRQLEAERRELSKKLSEESLARQATEIKLCDLQQVHDKCQANTDMVSIDKYESVKNTLHLLEDKFSNTMRIQADLSDDREKLEHTVLQLQGETDTIGEYVTLYQRQRALLKEQANKRDNEINVINSENAKVKDKLSHLQSLLVRLIKVRSHNNACKPTPEHRHLYPASASAASTPPLPPSSSPTKGKGKSARRSLMAREGREPESSLSPAHLTTPPSHCSDDVEDSTVNSEEDWPTDIDSDVDSHNMTSDPYIPGDIEKELMSLCNIQDIGDLTEFLNDPRWSYKQCDNCRGPMLDL